MNEEKNPARRIQLVQNVRRVRRQTPPVEYHRIEARIIPCCKTCRHNTSKICMGVPSWQTVGLPIGDEENLCEYWAPSVKAFRRALDFAFPPVTCAD